MYIKNFLAKFRTIWIFCCKRVLGESKNLVQMSDVDEEDPVNLCQNVRKNSYTYRNLDHRLISAILKQNSHNRELHPSCLTLHRVLHNMEHTTTRNQAKTSFLFPSERQKWRSRAEAGRYLPGEG